MWPLGAIAELIDKCVTRSSRFVLEERSRLILRRFRSARGLTSDRCGFATHSAQDAECGATAVHVDVIDLDVHFVKNPDNYRAIIVQDDGVGMNRRLLHGMLSFGFSDKEHKSGNVGRFGIGFKSGSMRLAKDVLIFTKREGYAHAAFLSQSFLDGEGYDDILIPMFSWRHERDAVTGKMVYVATEPVDTKKWDDHMSVIFKYSFARTEADLLKQLDKISGKHGTRIVLFNLRDPPELDWSFTDDIRLVGAFHDSGDMSGSRRDGGRGPVFQQTREGQQQSLDVPEDYSLRAYMEILYLEPRCTFTLRGKKVETRHPITSMLKEEYYIFPPYKPRGAEHSPFIFHMGYAKESTSHSKKCGFHIYNKNRLIRLYQRFGSQLQANTMMKDLLGVIEADALEPTHNKQAFREVDVLYQKFKKQIVECMKDYYFGIQTKRFAGGGGRKDDGRRTKSKKATKRKKVLRGKKPNGSGAVSSDENGDADNEQVEPRQTSARRGRSATPQSRMQSIHRIIMTNKNAYMFLKPVDPVYWEIPDYFDVIKNPMDLGTIMTKLEKREYENQPSAYAADVRLVWSNAMTYNKEEEPVYKMARIMSREFEYQWSSKFLELDLTSTKIEGAAEEEEESDEDEYEDVKSPASVVERPSRKRQIVEAMGDGEAKEGKLPESRNTPRLLQNNVVASSASDKRHEKPGVPMRFVRVPNALTSIMDESYFKNIEDTFLRLEQELAEERAMNARIIDENLKRGVNNSETVSVEELETYADELARLRERVKVYEDLLEEERGRTRNLEERIEKLKAEKQALKEKRNKSKSGGGSGGREGGWRTRRATGVPAIDEETEKLYQYCKRNCPYEVNVGEVLKDWKVHIFERKGGIHAGAFYNEYVSPDGTKCRSMKEVVAYLTNGTIAKDQAPMVEVKADPTVTDTTAVPQTQPPEEREAERTVTAFSNEMFPKTESPTGVSAEAREQAPEQAPPKAPSPATFDTEQPVDALSMDVHAVTAPMDVDTVIIN